RQEEPPALVFTGFRVFEQEKHFEKHISFMDKVVLAYADNFFSIEFALLDYRPGQKRNYAYQLEGYDADWVYPADGRRVASYTDVREGSYTFRVKALDPYNPQQERSKAIELEVLPPWYRSPWAYSLYALAALMTAFLSRREILRRERLKNQHKLEALELQKMKELDELRLRFFANISHEFRTPLTVIQGMADEIQSNFAKLDSWHISERLEAIHRNSKQLLRLVNQILDLSKLEANAMKLQPVQDDFVAFLRYLTQPFATYAASRSIRFIFQSTDKNLVADFDPHKLADIVSNLLSNALKFTPAGGEINLQIAKGKQAIAQFTGRATEELDNKLLIRISDTGIGISPDKLPHIFDRFYQVDDSSTRAGEGTGIGLALTRELVLLMGGEIEVMSETGKGTTFHILLPHTRQARTGNATQLAFSEHISGIQSPTEAPSSTPSATKGELPLILLVEDHADVRQYLKAALKGPYRLLAAANGAEGIRKALHHIPDLIISDVMMPEKDGLELTNTLKQDEKTSHVPIILLTARAAVEDRLAGLKRGADAYITKPFLREELLLRVNNLLEVRKQLRKRYAALSPLAPPPDEATQIEDFFLLKVNKFIEQKIDDPGLDVPALAGEMNMSRSQLHRKLKALTDRSASAYIRAFRLQRARQQLEKGNVRVAEVAYSVGFQDPNYFSRAFSKEFGIRPSEITPN
ncbi:MAG: response regulator, partial [Bacteroidetes bacterium]